MTIDEILTAIEWLDTTDIVPILEVITAKLATDFGYADSYAAPVEEEMPVEEDIPVEEMPEEDMWRLSL